MSVARTSSNESVLMKIATNLLTTNSLFAVYVPSTYNFSLWSYLHLPETSKKIFSHRKLKVVAGTSFILSKSPTFKAARTFLDADNFAVNFSAQNFAKINFISRQNIFHIFVINFCHAVFGLFAIEYLFRVPAQFRLQKFQPLATNQP